MYVHLCVLTDYHRKDVCEMELLQWVTLESEWLPYWKTSNYHCRHFIYYYVVLCIITKKKDTREITISSWFVAGHVELGMKSKTRRIQNPERRAN